ncbi:MAG: RHS domain-containing protein [Deltaproteobacteria bacterium]|nr:RHS domain-containing protein [Deltaproteobacteria bacterium]MCL5792868.1 RHS domain-containing protein [Deltaproteobacteria bacterium]
MSQNSHLLIAAKFLNRDLNPNDQYNRLAQVINGITAITTYGYDGNGNMVIQTDPDGNTTNYQYNALNKLSQVIQYISSTNAQTAYIYNLQGDLITATDANGNNADYTYDDMNRLVKVNSPDTGITRYWYDPNGNLIGKVDADNRTLNYTYDALNRLTSVIDMSNPSSPLITYYYDGQNPINTSITNGIGRLTGMQDSSGNTAYSYDARGNVIQETQSILGHQYVTSYAYDNDGNLASITLPSGRVVNYTYAADPNKPSSVSAMVNGVNTTIASNITYQPFGDLAGLTYGNGLPLTITTDATGEITNIQVGSIINRAYNNDNAGNVLTITTIPTTYTYSYDTLSRLTDSTGDYGLLTYSYDQAGNRLTATTPSNTINYSYYPGTNKLWNYNNPAGSTFLYDAAGYITNETVSGKQFQYDSLGRLTQVSNATGAVIGQYTYDGMNRRLTKTTGGVTTVFIYDIYNNLIGEYDASTGNTTKEYIYLGSKPLAMITESTSSSTTSSSSRGCGIIDTVRSTINTGCSTTGISLRNTGTMTGMGAIDGFIYLFPLIGIAIIRLSRNAKRRKLDIIGLLTIGGMVLLIVMISRQTHAQVTGETIYYYHLDHLGTPIEMTDQNQNVVWQASYDPFGQITISTATVTNNLRFPGMYADSETGLYYNMNRYYYPAIGRYIEPDPILQPMVNAQLNTSSMFNELLSFLAANPQQMHEYVYVLNDPLFFVDSLGLGYWVIGGTIDNIDVNWSSNNPTQTNFGLTTPQFGGGIVYCYTPAPPQPPPPNKCENNPPPVPPLEQPISWSYGLGKYLGVSVSNNPRTICFGFSPGVSLFPVSPEIPLGSIKW